MPALTAFRPLPSRVVSISDLRTLAQRRLPRVVFDYVDGGADAEVTLRENCRVFDDVIFRPRQAVYCEQCDLRATVLGHQIAFPAILAPVGYSRMIHPGGEVAAASAAGAAGTIYTLSTISGHPLENVKSAANGPAWYQLYLVGGRAVAERAIARAKAAGFSALAVTIDTPVAGMRERDHRNGMRPLLNGTFAERLGYYMQFLSRPTWLTNFLLDGGTPGLPNIVMDNGRPMPLMDVTAALAAAVVTWDDFRWIRAAWNGPIIAKGILTGDDARRAIDHGASAVVVSNHGGRQLDTVSPTLRVLPEVAAAARGQAEVFMDGGIRRGADIVKALCLGARAVLIGRGYAYGLAAAGADGVAHAVKIFRDGVERTMRLLGCPSIAELNPSWLELPHDWRLPD